MLECMAFFNVTVVYLEWYMIGEKTTGKVPRIKFMGKNPNVEVIKCVELACNSRRTLLPKRWDGEAADKDIAPSNSQLLRNRYNIVVRRIIIQRGCFYRSSSPYSIPHGSAAEVWAAVPEVVYSFPVAVLLASARYSEKNRHLRVLKNKAQWISCRAFSV